MNTLIISQENSPSVLVRFPNGNEKWIPCSMEGVSCGGCGFYELGKPGVHRKEWPKKVFPDIGESPSCPQCGDMPSRAILSPSLSLPSECIIKRK